MTDISSYDSTSSNESSVNKDDKLIFRPSSTTNYYASIFNINTKKRDILFEGAVPLHEIIYHLYDLFFNYINLSAANTITYLVAILKPEPPYRPDTPILIKIKGSNSKKERLKLVAPVIDRIITQFDSIFDIFINDSDGDIRTKTKYRTDTHRKVLIDSYKHYNNVIKPKIFNLIAN
tara:strand:+ start:1082 stop:1612 length:531 start_codon:yes stop_codon:yes gene_type:complete